MALGRPVVLYFSGNAGNRTYRLEEFQTFTRVGCDVFVFDYRGYGENEGSPTEKHLISDAVAAFRYATQQRDISPERMIVFGESIGGGVATRLASEASQAGTPPGGLHWCQLPPRRITAVRRGTLASRPPVLRMIPFMLGRAQRSIELVGS